MKIARTSILALLVVLAALFHIGSLYIYAKTGGAPVDYTSFMEIGERWVQGQSIYVENSYYPLPMVGIFAFFSQLPRPVSVWIWIGGKVLAAVLITGNPLIIAFSPLVSAQTSWIPMVGFWGYRRWARTAFGGAFLALITLKPHLAIVPMGWAVYQWLKAGRNKILERSLVGFIVTAAVLYVPAFLVYPGWMMEWLSGVRGLRERAMAGIVPRTLMYFDLQPAVFWFLVILAAVLLWFILDRKAGTTLDGLVIISFIVNPYAHNYDLIQLIPVLVTPGLVLSAVIASLPGWITIFMFYDIDRAWYVFTIIAPVVFVAYIRQFRQTVSQNPLPRGSLHRNYQNLAR